jgi:hypothetical protein
VHHACTTTPPAVRALSDEQFWQLSAHLSEPAGDFTHDDNLVSNEPLYAEFARLIRRRGGAYIGVGPEQNFSYIARLAPDVAFVVDIRQDNKRLHLLYKALFELSPDRAEFVSRLFSRPRSPGLQAGASVTELFAAIDAAQPSPHLLAQTRHSVRAQLMTTRRFPLNEDELKSIDDALDAFHADGPAIRYGRSEPTSKEWPSYRTLMTTTDLWGHSQSFLASEETYRVIRDLHSRNLVIPVVGNFAGPHSIRRVGDYIRAQGLLVSAFYASNVEVYLTRTQRRAFCASVGTLPFDDGTHFIGSRRLLPLREKLQACASLPPSMPFPEGFTPR